MTFIHRVPIYQQSYYQTQTLKQHVCSLLWIISWNIPLSGFQQVKNKPKLIEPQILHLLTLRVFINFNYSLDIIVFIILNVSVESVLSLFLASALNPNMQTLHTTDEFSVLSLSIFNQSNVLTTANNTLHHQTKWKTENTITM